MRKLHEKHDIRGLHLLAAEDNELNAEIIEMLLTDDGAKVTALQKRQTGGGALRK
ncbi:MAG: hypothetical protein ACLUGJ_18710 [Blautia wexlerae]